MTKYTPFDIYTTYLPDQVFRTFSQALASAPHWWDSEPVGTIEDSIYAAIGGGTIDPFADTSEFGREWFA